MVSFVYGLIATIIFEATHIDSTLVLLCLFYLQRTCVLFRTYTGEVIEMGLTLQPPHLRGRAVSLFVSGSYPEDDGWLCSVVDVCRCQASRGYHTGWVRTAVHTDKGQLDRCARFLIYLSGSIPHSQVYRILCDFTCCVLRWLPGQMSSFCTLQHGQ